MVLPFPQIAMSSPPGSAGPSGFSGYPGFQGSPGFPASFAPGTPFTPSDYSPPDGFPSIEGADYTDWGFRKTITFLQNPTVGTSFLALAIFFMIAFATNILLQSINIIVLGITVSFSVLFFSGLVILLLFLL